MIIGYFVSQCSSYAVMCLHLLKARPSCSVCLCKCMNGHLCAYSGMCVYRCIHSIYEYECKSRGCVRLRAQGVKVLARHVDSHVMPAGHYDVGITYQGHQPYHIDNFTTVVN